MKKIKFTGSFGDYFIKSLLLIVLCAVTLGIATPYYIYWNMKYFFTHLEVEA